MGSSLSRIYDDYSAYEELCKVVQEEPLEVREDGEKSFYDHERELIKKYGYDKTYYGYKKSS